MLVPLPIGAFVSSLIFDILTQTRAGSLPYLVDGAIWLIGVGLAGALVAAVPGMLDLRMIPRGATCPRHRAHAPDAERRGARAVRGRLCPTGLRGRATRAGAEPRQRQLAGDLEHHAVLRATRTPVVVPPVLEPPGAPDPVTLSAAAVFSLLPVLRARRQAAQQAYRDSRSHTCCG
jgi:hypothetical protein